MKGKEINPAPLVIFFSISFVTLLLGALFFRFLGLRIDEIKTIPGQPFFRFPDLVSSLRWALSPALYLSILMTLSYASRQKFPVFFSVFCLLILSLAAVIGLTIGISRLRSLPAASIPKESAPVVHQPNRKGLILSGSGASMILLKEPQEIRGPRVVALPGQGLIYQEQPLGPNNTILPLPPLPYRNETTPLLASLTIDFSLSSRYLEDSFSGGIFSLIIYAGALTLLLVSLRFVLDIGSWPLASLFLGALAFRGILSLETFLNTSEVQDMLFSLTGNWLPRAYVSSAVFAALALLILLYTALAQAIKTGRPRNG
ncbi:hypothetical protein AGMMS49928_06320 [Spirochaetia bacterium]|nr:hypothetical protein AGMMS49928_06320 [Spirochaetia bacterium]